MILRNASADQSPPTNAGVCSRCIYDLSLAGVVLDESGICNYCHLVDDLADLYGTGTERGAEKLRAIFSEIQDSGRGKRYDCVVGVSGGTDSSFVLLKAVEAGLRPLAVHYDNTWNTALASANIQRVTSALEVDLHTFVVDNFEIDDIKKSFLLARVREFDADTDLAFVQVIRSVAARFGIKYILEGHSFVAEGFTPANQNYLDGAYIEDVHDRFGSVRRKTFPNMTFWQFLKWSVVYRQKFIRPLWYLDYSKEDAKAELSAKTGWVDYGGHHLENRASAFAHTIYLPQKFGTDYRILALAARARSGLLERDAALEIYRRPILPDPSLRRYVIRRLGLTEDDLDKIIRGGSRDWTQFKTYKRRFEALRPLFFLLARAELIPRSFYLKYCFPIKPEANGD